MFVKMLTDLLPIGLYVIETCQYVAKMGVGVIMIWTMLELTLRMRRAINLTRNP